MAEQDEIAIDRALGHAPRFGETGAEAAAREGWERRLAPLLLSAPDAAPSTGLLARIEAELDRPAAGAETLPLRRALRIWKGAAGLALAAAAALAIYVAQPREAEGARYVAVVTADDGSGPGLVIQFDTGTGVATVVPVAAAPSGNSYEMWTIPAGATKPVSLGLLPPGPDARADFSASDGQIFAISLEPPGGSPTGQPTLPLFHGKLARVD